MKISGRYNQGKRIGKQHGQETDMIYSNARPWGI
jgi:hypothetical protein